MGGGAIVLTWGKIKFKNSSMELYIAKREPRSLSAHTSIFHFFCTEKHKNPLVHLMHFQEHNFFARENFIP